MNRVSKRRLLIFFYILYFGTRTRKIITGNNIDGSILCLVIHMDPRVTFHSLAHSLRFCDDAGWTWILQAAPEQLAILTALFCSGMIALGAT